MLRRAAPADVAFVATLWTQPCDTHLIDAPDDGRIAESIAAGLVFLWAPDGPPLGFAALTEWGPGVPGLRAIVTAPSCWPVPA